MHPHVAHGGCAAAKCSTIGLLSSKNKIVLKPVLTLDEGWEIFKIVLLSIIGFLIGTQKIHSSDSSKRRHPETQANGITRQVSNAGKQRSS